MEGTSRPDHVLQSCHVSSSYAVLAVLAVLRGPRRPGLLPAVSLSPGQPYAPAPDCALVMTRVPAGTMAWGRAHLVAH